MLRIFDTPQSLHQMAQKATDGKVEIDSDRLKLTAEMWFKDKEKIRYLEGLLLRKSTSD